MSAPTIQFCGYEGEPLGSSALMIGINTRAAGLDCGKPQEGE